jgi:hypothetical protein
MTGRIAAAAEIAVLAAGGTADAHQTAVKYDFKIAAASSMTCG